MNRTKAELCEESKNLLLNDQNLPKEQLLTHLKGYFVYLVDKDNKIQYYGFLAGYDKIVIPPISDENAKNYIIKIQNGLTQGLKNYKFVGQLNEEHHKTIEVKVSAYAQKLYYP